MPLPSLLARAISLGIRNAAQWLRNNPKVDTVKKLQRAFNKENKGKEQARKKGGKVFSKKWTRGEGTQRKQVKKQKDQQRHKKPEVDSDLSINRERE